MVNDFEYVTTMMECCFTSNLNWYVRFKSATIDRRTFEQCMIMFNKINVCCCKEDKKCLLTSPPTCTQSQCCAIWLL